MPGARLRFGCWVILFASLAASGDAASDLALVYNRGQHDKVIVQANGLIGVAGVNDKALRYLRGMSYYRIAWFGAAAQDLVPLGDYAPWPRWPSAAQESARLATLRQLAPTHTTVLTQGRTAIFRVYCDEDNDWSKAVIATLPEAYRQVCGYFGVQLAETTALIFHDGPRYNSFYRTWSGATPTSWQWATGSGGALLYCECDADGKRATDPAGDYFRGCIAHEFAHCLVNRVLGTTPLPPWLNEGLAMCCGALLAPNDNTSNDAAMRTLVSSGRLLPVETVIDGDQFYQHPGEAYPQAFSMARFLTDRVGHDGVINLLNALLAERDLDRALQRSWKIDQRGLYAAWRRTVTPQ